MTVSVVNLFAPVSLTTTAVTLYTVAATPPTLVLARARLRFTNVDSAAHSVTAYAIPFGGAATVTNCFVNAESIAGNSHLDTDVPLLGLSGFIQAKCDVNNDVSAAALDGVLFS